MYAVVRTGGKQYRVSQGMTFDVELLEGASGDAITFDDVLLVSNGTEVKVGRPVVSGATVKATIVAQVKDPKKIAFKKTRRQDTRKKKGHRQPKTRVRVVEIAA